MIDPASCARLQPFCAVNETPKLMPAFIWQGLLGLAGALVFFYSAIRNQKTSGATNKAMWAAIVATIGLTDLTCRPMVWSDSVSVGARIFDCGLVVMGVVYIGTHIKTMIRQRAHKTN